MDVSSTKAERAARRKADDGRGSAEPAFCLAVSDPQPVTEVARLWRTAAQAATIGMFVILLVVGA